MFGMKWVEYKDGEVWQLQIWIKSHSTYLTKMTAVRGLSFARY